MIFYDGTEGRKGTALPKNVRDYGQQVIHLEKYTGADLLISPLDLKMPDKLTDSKPHQMILKKHCQAGMLVQRASGRDALNHIKNASVILRRMQEWSPLCFFLKIGYIGYNPRSKKATMRKKDTGWNYASFLGMKASWQKSGGYYEDLPIAAAMLPWVKQWEERLKDGDENIIISREKVTPLSESKHSKQVAMLSHLPDVGPVRGDEMIKEYGSIANCLMWLSARSYDKRIYPSGITENTLKKCRSFLGLKKNQWLFIEGVPDDYPIAITWPNEAQITYLSFTDGEPNFVPFKSGHRVVYPRPMDFVIVVIDPKDIDKAFSNIKVNRLKG